MTSNELTPVLEPKTNRPPEEVGREVVRLLDQHDEVRVRKGDNEYDIQIFVRE